MGDSLSGKAVLVTGAASGMGRATALRLAGAGASVALLDRSAVSEVSAECERLGARVLGARLDVGDEASVAAAVEAVGAWAPELSGVVHLAGHLGGGSVPFESVTSDDWHDVITANLTGAFYVARHTQSLLEAGRGVLVLGGSGAGVLNSHPAIPYAVSKAGMNGLAIALEEPFRKRGIRVVNLLIGTVNTPLLESAGAPAELVASAIDPGDVAEMIAFLVSDAATAIRGPIRTW